LALWGRKWLDRQWGTVREDYSESSDAWNYLTYEEGVRVLIAGAKMVWRNFRLATALFRLDFLEWRSNP
jgi:hypothetical protein